MKRFYREKTTARTIFAPKHFQTAKGGGDSRWSNVGKAADVATPPGRWIAKKITIFRENIFILFLRNRYDFGELFV